LILNLSFVSRLCESCFLIGSCPQNCWWRLMVGALDFHFHLSKLHQSVQYHTIFPSFPSYRINPTSSPKNVIVCLINSINLPWFIWTWSNLWSSMWESSIKVFLLSEDYIIGKSTHSIGNVERNFDNSAYKCLLGSFIHKLLSTLLGVHSVEDLINKHRPSKFFCL